MVVVEVVVVLEVDVDVVLLELDVVVLGVVVLGVVVVVVPRLGTVIGVKVVVVVLVAVGSSSPGDPGARVVDDDVEDDDVVDEARLEVVGGASPPVRLLSRRSSPRPSGEAVNTCSTGRSATAGFMAAAQMRAGKEPPVTRWPWTSVIGTIFSGYPTQTAVDRCGTKPTNQASP